MPEHGAQAKSWLGWASTGIWLVVVVCLFLADDGLQSLLTWQAALFVVAGLAAAILIVGYANRHVLHPWRRRLEARHGADRLGALVARGRTAFGVLDLVLGVAFLVLIYAAVYWA